MESLVIGPLPVLLPINLTQSLEKEGTMGVMLGFVIMMFLDTALE